MQEFNLDHLTNLYFSGYRYVIVMNRRDHVMLKPIKKEASAALVRAMNYNQLPLLSTPIIGMATGEYPAFLPEEIYEPNYKDYVLSRE